MNTEAAKAQQAIVFAMDDNCEELPIEEYLKVLRSLEIVIAQRISAIQLEVDKKNKELENK
jgi:hypothetical protein